MKKALLPFLLFAATCSSLPVARCAGQSANGDTLAAKYIPTGIRIGYDLISAGKTYFQDNYKGWEFQGDVDFNRYYLALEYGNSGMNRASDSASYANDGRYWRVGVDVNFLTKDPDQNMFFLGMRYGRSAFSETLDVVRYDPDWGLFSGTFHQNDASASWLELATGLRVRVWKLWWLGYTARFKFALNAKGSDNMIPFDVPGYGFNDKDATWGFNYYVMFRIPVRKSPAPPVTK